MSMASMEKHLFNLKFAAKELERNSKKCDKVFNQSSFNQFDRNSFPMMSNFLEIGKKSICPVFIVVLDIIFNIFSDPFI